MGQSFAWRLCVSVWWVEERPLYYHLMVLGGLRGRDGGSEGRLRQRLRGTAGPSPCLPLLVEVGGTSRSPACRGWGGGAGEGPHNVSLTLGGGGASHSCFCFQRRMCRVPLRAWEPGRAAWESGFSPLPSPHLGWGQSRSAAGRAPSPATSAQVSPNGKL